MTIHMLYRTLGIGLTALLIHANLPAQNLHEVINQTITVNSRTAINGNTRNIISADIPENANGFIYRISIFKKGQSALANASLLLLLRRAGGLKIALGTALIQYVIKSNDNQAVDAFIFTNEYDATSFYAKKDESWSACKTMLNTVNCCFSTSECQARQIYFGFRNNNIRQGLNVRIEIVAML
jgi:hypothetical protein